MTDLTKIKWAHAVNTEFQLNEALNDDNIDIIEADIILGRINNSGSLQPVMGHPPMQSSDITLNDFLLKIFEFNRNSVISKGVKLDFKSIEVFESSVNILDQLWEKVSSIQNVT
ncbi:FAM151B family protein [Megaselia abdita]